jgi:hypothetical protein
MDMFVYIFQRPYEIHSNTSLAETKKLFMSQPIHYPSSWEPGMVEVLQKVSYRIS